MRPLTLKKKLHEQKGYSIIELAISLVIIGTLFGTALGVYHNYSVTQNIDRTEKYVLNLTTALGNFRAVYGRYPCPAPFNAKPGDAAYGLEESNCKGDRPNGVPPDYGTGGSTFANGLYSADAPSGSGKFIVIGSIPFKSIGLQENQIFDGYENRITYAVTAEQTDRTTFDMIKGEIGLEDKAGNSLVVPANSAHFVLVSHGPDGEGAGSREGTFASPCPGATVFESKNCDQDGIFVLDEKARDIDDFVDFFTPVQMSYWEKTTNIDRDIHLKTSGSTPPESIVVGATTATNLTNAQDIELYTKLDGTGTAWAENENFLSSYLCEYGSAGAADCFKSSLFGGLIADGEGMNCDTKFLVAVENGAPRCENEVYIGCPDNSYMAGIDTEGHIICDVPEAASCDAMGVTNVCGAAKSLPGALHGTYASVLNGTCYFFDAPTNWGRIDWKHFIETPPKTDAQIQAKIDQLNATTREMKSCDAQEGPGDSNSALIRETRQCSNGEWSEPDDFPFHERRQILTKFPSDRKSNVGAVVAEPGMPPTPVPYDLTHDPNHNISDHDCWCREDFRYLKNQPCGEGYDPTGTKDIIQKAECPSTEGSFKDIYESDGSCVCDGSGTYEETPRCWKYYENTVVPPAKPGSLEGLVTLTWPRKCVAGKSIPDKSGDPLVDFSDCYCPSNPPVVEITYCPPGTTNTFTIPGETLPRKGIKAVKITNWICPGAAPDGHPIPGYWDTPVDVPNVPECVCDANYTKYVTEPCDPSLSGKGTKYRVEWDCAANAWEDRANWEKISEDCRPCSWRSSATPELRNFAPGVELGSPCSCNEKNGVCHDFAGGGMYNIFTPCQCVVTP